MNKEQNKKKMDDDHPITFVDYCLVEQYSSDRKIFHTRTNKVNR